MEPATPAGTGALGSPQGDGRGQQVYNTARSEPRPAAQRKHRWPDRWPAEDQGSSTGITLRPVVPAFAQCSSSSHAGSTSNARKCPLSSL